MIQTERGTLKTRGAAFTNQSAASPARLSIASCFDAAQCTKVNTAICAFTNWPAGWQCASPFR